MLGGWQMRNPSAFCMPKLFSLKTTQNCHISSTHHHPQCRHMACVQICRPRACGPAHGSCIAGGSEALRRKHTLGGTRCCDDPCCCGSLQDEAVALGAAVMAARVAPPPEVWPDTSTSRVKHVMRWSNAASCIAMHTTSPVSCVKAVLTGCSAVQASKNALYIHHKLPCRG